MGERELQDVLEVQPPDKADGILLGKRNGKAIVPPRGHSAQPALTVFGASGTGKSRDSSVRPCSTSSSVGSRPSSRDSKGELYADTAELFRQHGYEVKVFNLVNPEHGDSWNCMSDLGGDTLLAQVLLTSSSATPALGKPTTLGQWGGESPQGPHPLCRPRTPTRSPEKNLPQCMRCSSVTAPPSSLPCSSGSPWTTPPVAPYRLFSQASDTVRSGIVLGLGTGSRCCKTGGGPYSPPQRYRPDRARGRENARPLWCSVTRKPPWLFSVRCSFLPVYQKADTVRRQHPGHALPRAGEPHLG